MSTQKNLESQVRLLEIEVARLRGQIEVLKPMADRALSPPQADAGKGARPLDRGGWLGCFVAMTLKQRATVLAILGGRLYKDVALVMGVDQTTVKVHMRSALEKLSLKSKLELMSVKEEIIAELMSVDAESVLSVAVDWADNPSPDLIEKLGKVRMNTPPPGGATKK